jgi:cell wall-associated NlpC family hydrolase
VVKADRLGLCRRGGAAWLGLLLLTGCASAPYRPVDSARAAAVVAEAKALLGKPYRFGGALPDGFDCSGFVLYVYRQAVGIHLPHSSQKQYGCGRPIPVGAEAPSDLIFFSIDGCRPSHVGIYLGRGRFIHAPDKGDRVKISNANDRYWRQRFIGLRRVLD